MKQTILFLPILLSILSCESKVNKKEAQIIYRTSLKTFTEAEYPDNNMIGFKSKLAGTYRHNGVWIQANNKGNYDITILPGNQVSDTLTVQNVNLLEMMPSVPEYVKNNAYLSQIAVLNQEWNRVQVKYTNPSIAATGNGTEKNIVARVDIANNCIQKGLWEILTYTSTNHNDSLYFQSWFDFPEDLYNQLFKQRNGIDIAQYDKILKDYPHTQGERIDLSVLRTITSEKTIPFANLNNQLYPMKGERETKERNIMSPRGYTSINDLLTDQSTFATFAPPGIYTQSDPRHTTLSRLRNPIKAFLRQTISANSAKTHTSELQIDFTNPDKTKSTQWIIGGLQLNKLPLLNSATQQKGWQRSMGIANHSFYVPATDFDSTSSLTNPYFSFLLDEKGNWLDSHAVGIDGPLLFRDEKEPNKVHLLILSFERHAFVGHYVFDIPKT